MGRSWSATCILRELLRLYFIRKNLKVFIFLKLNFKSTTETKMKDKIDKIWIVSR